MPSRLLREAYRESSRRTECHCDLLRLRRDSLRHICRLIVLKDHKLILVDLAVPPPENSRLSDESNRRASPNPLFDTSATKATNKVEANSPPGADQ